MRTNLEDQKAWLGSCHSWPEAFETRLDLAALECVSNDFLRDPTGCKKFSAVMLIRPEETMEGVSFRFLDFSGQFGCRFARKD